MMKTTVELIDVSKRYRLGISRTSVLSSVTNFVRQQMSPQTTRPEPNQTLWALKDISFRLQAGETVGFLGSNGAGKTTLLKLLAKITRPTSGRLNINGRLSALIELGAGFHMDLTGRENVYLNGSILGLSYKEVHRLFDDIVAFSEIERFIDTPMKRYSSGMKVRLGFAVASCIQPDILLVDEVLAVGDAMFRQKCMNRINELRNAGTSICFVSHNLYQVQAVCTSAVYLEHGQIKYQGETAKVIDAYERDIHVQRAHQFEQLDDEPSAAPQGIEVTDVRLLSAGSDQPSDWIYSSQRADIQIFYTAYTHLERAHVVVRILRADGLTCCMLRTSVDSVPLTIPTGSGAISVTLEPLQLVGSAYFVDVRITDGSDSLVLASARSKWFYVQSDGLSHEAESGVFRPNSNWHHAAYVSPADVKSQQNPQQHAMQIQSNSHVY